MYTFDETVEEYVNKIFDNPKKTHLIPFFQLIKNNKRKDVIDDWTFKMWNNNDGLTKAEAKVRATLEYMAIIKRFNRILEAHLFNYVKD
jgi:hypothetical protein